MIRDRGVATRYAAALFGAAISRKELEQVDSDLRGLEALYAHDTAFQNFLEAPNVLDGDKEKIVRAVLGGRVSEVVLQFCLLMLRKKRIAHLPLVFDPFRRLVEQHLGLERAEVVTAIPLPPAQAEEMKTRLESMTGRKVALVTKVDPRILAGAVVTIGGTFDDPKIRPDLAGLAKARVNEEIEKHKDEVKQKLQDKLKDLFNR